MKYDELMDHLGELGPYQVKVYILTCLPVIAVSMQTLIPVFILAVPQHRCATQNRNETYNEPAILHRDPVNATLTRNETYNVPAVLHRDPLSATLTRNTNNYSAESEDHERAGCHIWVSLRTPDGDKRQTQNQSLGSVTLCDHWTYDKSDFHNTFLTQIDLVCERSSLRSHANMVYMAGFLVGSFVFGIFADVKGRKPSLFIAIILQLVTSVLVVFCTNYVTFVVCRFLTGVSNMGIMLSAFVLGMELVGRRWRTVAGVAINFFWCAGMLLLDLLAYGIRDWKHLQLAASCYAVLFLPMWWLLPESCRWLMSKDRMEEARAILEKIAQSNKRDIPAEAFTGPDRDHQQGRIIDMFLHPVLVLRTAVVFLNWLVVNLVYYGLTLNVGSLGGSIYVNFALNGLVETLGNVATLGALPRMGRKRFHSVAMLLSGAVCLCCMIPTLIGQSAPSWIIILLSNIGKFWITGGYSTIYVFSAELFPTGLRNSVLGSCSMVARVGGMIAPYVADLSLVVDGAVGTALPFLVFGSSGLLAGLLALTLPETLNMALPDTIQDAVQFGKKKPVPAENREERCPAAVGEWSSHSGDTHTTDDDAHMIDGSYAGNINLAFEMVSV